MALAEATRHDQRSSRAAWREQLVEGDRPQLPIGEVLDDGWERVSDEGAAVPGGLVSSASWSSTIEPGPSPASTWWTTSLGLLSAPLAPHADHSTVSQAEPVGGPECRPRGLPIGRTEPVRRRRTHLAHDVDRSRQISGDPSRGSNEVMRVLEAVDADDVSARRDLGDELRVPLDVRPEAEERGLHPQRIEAIEQAFRVAGDRAVVEGQRHLGRSRPTPRAPAAGQGAHGEPLTE